MLNKRLGSQKLGGSRLWGQLNLINLNPITQGLLLLLLIKLAVVLPSVLWAVGDRLIADVPVKARELPFFHLLKLLTLQQDLDSWEPMWQAFEQLKAAPREPLYAHIFFGEHTKFQYPLTSLLLFYGLEFILTPFGVSSPEGLYRVLAVLSWLSFLGLLGVSAAIFWTAWRQAAGQAAAEANASAQVNSPAQGEQSFPFKASAFNGLGGLLAPRRVSKAELGLILCLLLVLGLTFYPAIRAYSLGQIQAWINLSFGLMLWCWMRGKKRAAGLLGGLVCLVKPQYGVFLLWGLLRRQWQFVAAFLGVSVSGWLVAAGMFGWANNLDYLKVLSYISKRGEAYYPNQSVNGLMNRLLFNGSNLTWTGDAFAPFSIWVYGLTLLSSLGLLLLALRPPRRSRGGSADLALVALVATMASPIAWEHHYGILLPLYAWLGPQLLRHSPWGRWTWPLFGMSFVLAGNYFYAARKVAEVPLLNALQSYLFFGALLVLGLLVCLRDRPWVAPSAGPSARFVNKPVC